MVTRIAKCKDETMKTDPRECMFCHDPLPRRADQPVNLAFMEHVTNQARCKQEFEVWTLHMQRDYLGD